ncbi:LysR family transcriptional regulator [Vibrio cholerae]|nr:LysR family transcriptional regulator [Vibrio cholerae]
MRYSFKQLAVFDAVADCGSVSQAADKLAHTQSATSMSLAQLEKCSDALCLKDKVNRWH